LRIRAAQWNDREIDILKKFYMKKKDLKNMKKPSCLTLKRYKCLTNERRQEKREDIAKKIEWKREEKIKRK